jgi:hypothetical protein
MRKLRRCYTMSLSNRARRHRTEFYVGRGAKVRVGRRIFSMRIGAESALPDDHTIPPAQSHAVVANCTILHRFSTIEYSMYRLFAFPFPTTSHTHSGASSATRRLQSFHRFARLLQRRRSNWKMKLAQVANYLTENSYNVVLTGSRATVK